MPKVSKPRRRASPLLVAIILLASVCSATASAAMINFDDIDAPGPGGPGTIVNVRYSNLGVTFNDPEAFDYSEGPFAIPNFAHSPNVAVEPCVGAEFCSSPVRALFTAPQESVGIWAGFSYPLNSPLGVRLTGFNGSGAVVGTDEETLPANPNPTPVSVPLTINLGAPAITRLEVSVTTGGGYTSGLAVDDVEFSTVGPPPPCNATAPPTVALSQPADGLVVPGDAFPLQGSIATNGAPITDAAVVATSDAARTSTIYPALVSGNGGNFGPTNFGGLLGPGVNDVVVTATNCRGTGTSGARHVVRAVAKPGPHPPACVPQADHRAVHVATGPADLSQKLNEGFQGQLIVPFGPDFDMDDYLGTPLPSGVQLVGERGPLGERPLIHKDDNTPPTPLFIANGHDVCVEGLHFKGPTRSADRLKDGEGATAIRINQDPGNHAGEPDPVLIVDNEFDAWPTGAIEVKREAPWLCSIADEPCCTPIPKKEGCRKAPSGWTGALITREQARDVRIERNYIHHNLANGSGYGVVIGGQDYARIEGNVFDFNRHSVTSSGLSYSGYYARFNYLLQGGHSYPGSGGYGAHLDIHGSRDPTHWAGGIAGEYSDVSYNTIRGAQEYDCIGPVRCKVRPAFILRGRAEDKVEFEGNVVVHDKDGAVKLNPGDDRSLKPAVDANFRLVRRGNHYETDYSTKLATGDFDGDGRTDVFLSNGTGWFFSRAGIRPWEFLRPSNKLVNKLGFADIDNDGATDVLYRDNAGNLGYVRSGAAAQLTPLTTAPVAMRDLRFGDFDGDGLTDIFYTRNRQWQVWYGRTRTWTPTATSRESIDGMLFGEFDDVRGTDVAAVNGGRWSYSSGSTTTWARLNAKLVGSFERAVAEDFDGNGKTDIAFSNDDAWRYSPDGRKPLSRLRRNVDSRPLDRLLVGHFDNQPRATVVAYGTHNRNKFGIWRGLGSQSDFVKHSEENMR
jgi:hypothetical protein